MGNHYKPRKQRSSPAASQALAEKRGIPTAINAEAKNRVAEVLELDDLIENRLTKLEQLLEEGADAKMGVAQLRELRQICAAIRALKSKAAAITT